MYKKYVIILMLLSFRFALAQESPKKELDYKKEVKNTILTFFEGFHAGDTSKIGITIDSGLVLQTIRKNKKGKRKIVKTEVQEFLKTIHNRPDGQQWDERLLSFKIDTDGDIANVWTPYEFYFNGTFSHCGVNVFQLYHDGISWKIMALADTRNREGCQNSGE